VSQPKARRLPQHQCDAYQPVWITFARLLLPFRYLLLDIVLASYEQLHSQTASSHVSANRATRSDAQRRSIAGR